MKSIEVEIAIIGAGSAGLASAIEAKKEGMNVLILERNNELGGITLQCIHNGFGLKEFKEELTGPEYIQRFIDQVNEMKIPYMLDTMVIEITNEKEIYAVNNREGLLKIKTKAIILAMGCREKTRGAINIPGFRPSGIYTAGQAQRFVNIEGYIPGNSFVILGSGDIGMIMARRLTWMGCVVKAVVEIKSYVSGLIRNQVQCLEDYNIPLILNHTITKIHGKDRVEGVSISSVDQNWDRIVGSEEFIECDSILLSVGLVPENELSVKAGCELSDNGGPVVDENLETTVEGIFASGNVLQVHDLVDNVTAESRRAGKNAAMYVKELRDNEKDKKDLIKIITGINVAYVKPDYVNFSNIQNLLHFNLRVKEPDRDVIIVIKEVNKIIYQRVRTFVIPSEMIEVRTKFKPGMVSPNCKELKFEVLPVSLMEVIEEVK
jgi:thioredoxin reductase